MVKIETVKEANAAKGDIERVVRAWCDARDAEAAAKPAPKRAKRPR